MVLVLSTLADPFVIAWWISAAAMVLSAYLVTPTCERSDPSLMIFGVGSGLFGVSVGMFVRYPEWTPELLTPDTLLTVALVMLALLGAWVTVFIWRYYTLQRPDKRLWAILAGTYDRLAVAVHAIRTTQEDD